MRLVQRDPNTAYLDTWLWVPKHFTNPESVKKALSFSFTDSYSEHKARYVYLWKETTHHILVPRHFWDVRNLPYRVVDLRPQSYPAVDITSNIKLDHRMRDHTLVPTGDDVQRKSLDALLSTTEGILQLACVSGDTVINVNRGGKGFKVRIEDAYNRSIGKDKSSWDSTIPTYIRSAKGDRIGLQRVIAFIKRGERHTYELELVDGKKLRLTEDHEVLTPGGYKPLKSLKSGDEVIVDGNRKSSACKKKLAYRRIGGFNHHPYARYQSRSYCIEEHRAIVEADLNGLTLEDFRECCRIGQVGHLRFIDPKIHHVHHKDENIYNNSLDNLEVLPKEEHLKGHRPGAAAFGYGVPMPVKISRIHYRLSEIVYDVACEAPYNNFVANGIVVHNCGKGKTCVALELAAQMKVPTLIVLPDTQLLEQWTQEIANLLNVPDGVGLIQGAKNDWRKPVVLTTYHTLGARAANLPEEVLRWFGLIIWDEGHHVPAPTFSASAEAFYGKRVSLTATPERDDGLHIISMYHIGPVVYKDLTPVQKPRIFFKWTGLSVDETRPGVSIRDRNGEVHGSKVMSYFAKWAERRADLLNDAAYAVQCGRKVLVLSSSESEIANLAAMWSSGNIGLTPTVPLYTDIPIPTPHDVGETLPPVELEESAFNRITEKTEKLRRRLAHATNISDTYVKLHDAWQAERIKPPPLDDPKAPKDPARQDPDKLEELNEQMHQYILNSLIQGLQLSPGEMKVAYELQSIEVELHCHRVFKKVTAEMERRQKAFIKDLSSKLINCGIMLHKVSPQERKRYIDTMPIVFAIMKYGKEGLDSEELDTILVSSTFSSRNGLQQLMGRPTRDFIGKKSPVIVFYEDNIGHVIGMCKKLKKHLREWTRDEGGPYEFEYLGHPTTDARKGTWIQNLQRIFGR